MGNIVLQGWEAGFNKIALTRLLRTQFGYSLGEAKRLVDQVLGNRPLALAVPECAMADTRLTLARIGVRVQKQEAAAAS